MKRKIEQRPAIAAPINTTGLAEVGEWLFVQAQRYGLRWLLAHADDGVIWGRVEGDGLLTSGSVAQEISPPLCLQTLQQARLFAPHAELFLWRDGNNLWFARLIRDAQQGEAPTWEEAIDEPYILWGTAAKPLGRGFTLMIEGGQGFRHAVPVEVRRGNLKEKLLCLWVRHYLGEDTDGFARIATSRLVKLGEWE